MLGETINLNDIIKIYQIRTKNKKKEKYERNTNFEEFREVYKDVFTSKNVNQTGASGSKIKSTKRKWARPLKELKTIRLEMPVLGTEKAILQPKESEDLSIKKHLNTKKQLNDQKTNLSHEIIEKWSRMEKEASGEKSNIDPTAFLEETNKDIDIAAAQLEKIRGIINSRRLPEIRQSSTSLGSGKSVDALKQVEKSRKQVKSPTYKQKKKPDRHMECVSKKYMTTLTTMKQKLQKLEDKYFSRPQIIYKNVRDIFTQPSNIEVLYSDSQNAEEVEEALRSIKRDLDAIANPPLGELEISPSPRDSSRKTSVTYNRDYRETTRRPVVSYSSIIDQSERKLNKMRAIKQDIVDVETFCDKLCKIGEEESSEHTDLIDREDKQDQLEELDKLHQPHQLQTSKEIQSQPAVLQNTGNGIFDGTELQKSVSRSSYLMKEFNMPSVPSIKVFRDSSCFISNTNKFLEGESTRKPSENSITSLIDHLNMALDNSIYKAAHS